jgi:hypothetical protein
MINFKFKFKGWYLPIIGLLAAFTTSCNKQQVMVLASPDGQIVVNAWLTDSNQIFYQVKLNANLVMTIQLGLIRQDADFSSGLNWKQVSEISQVSDKYELAVHKKAEL